MVAIFQQHDGVIGLAELAGAFDDGLEHRFDIGRRGGDHPEDIGAPGLVGEGLGEIAGLGLHFVEQPDILDGDHGLVGEGLQQVDLLGTERDRLQSTQDYCTDSLAFLQQGYGKGASVTLLQRPSLPLGKLGCSLWSQKVRNLYRHLVDDRSTSDPLSSDAVRFAGCGYWSVMGAIMQVVLNFEQHCGVVGVAEPASTLDNRSKCRPNVGRRRSDHLKHVGGGRLLLQSFTQIVGALADHVEQPRVLDGDDGLVGEGLKQLNVMR